MTKEHIKKIKSLFKIHGVFVGFLYILYLCKMLTDIKDVYCLKVDLLAFQLPTKTKKILDRAERITPIQIAFLQSIEPKKVKAFVSSRPDVSRAYIEDILQRKDIIFYTYRKDEICSTSFVGLTHFDIFGSKVMFPAQCAYLYRTFVKPEYRSKGHYMKLMIENIRYLKQSGYTTAFCLVYKDNRQALSNLEKINFVIYAHSIYVKLLGIRLFFNRRFITNSEGEQQRAFSFSQSIPVPNFFEERAFYNPRGQFVRLLGKKVISVMKAFLRPIKQRIQDLPAVKKRRYVTLYLISQHTGQEATRFGYFCREVPDKTVIKKMIGDRYTLHKSKTFHRNLLLSEVERIEKDVNCIIIDAEHDFLRQCLKRRKDFFFMPKWIVQKNSHFSGMGDFKRTKKSQKMKSAFWDLKCTQARYNYSYVFTREYKLLEYFYNNMYVPYMQNRFQDRVLLSSFGSAYKSFNEGGLFLLKEGQRFLAGSVVELQKGVLKPKFIGVVDGDMNLLKKRVIAAVHSFYFKFAEAKKIRVIDLGLSRSFLNDGALQQKVKWNTTIEFDKSRSTVYAMKIRYLTEPLRSFFLDNPFITLEEGNLHGNVVLAENDSVSEEAIRRKYTLKGISSLRISRMPGRTSGFTIGQPVKVGA